MATRGLRAGVLEEAARSLELSEAVSSLEELLTGARADKAMHAKSFEAYRALEASRRAFAALQFRHLKRELAFLACSLVSSDDLFLASGAAALAVAAAAPPFEEAAAIAA